MKKFAFVLAAAGLMSLAACDSAQENSVENAGEVAADNLEMMADNMDAMADNATTDTGAMALENQADNLNAAADNVEEAADEKAGNM